jgi:hypothetical protein
MNKTILLVCSLASLAALAEDKAPAMEAPKPAAELAGVAWMAGTWNCKGTVPAGAMGPNSPAESYKGTAVIKKTLDGFWYSLEYRQQRSKTHPLAIRYQALMGYDSAQKKLIMLGADNMGGNVRSTSTGMDGDKLVFTGEGSFMGAAATSRDTVTKAEGEVTWEAAMKPAGAADFVVLSVDKCKISASGPMAKK